MQNLWRNLRFTNFYLKGFHFQSFCLYFETSRLFQKFTQFQNSVRMSTLKIKTSFSAILFLSLDQNGIVNFYQPIFFTKSKSVRFISTFQYYHNLQFDYILQDLKMQAYDIYYGSVDDVESKDSSQFDLNWRLITNLAVCFGIVLLCFMIIFVAVDFVRRVMAILDRKPNPVILVSCPRSCIGTNIRYATGSNSEYEQLP